jgi:ribonuclease HI
MKINIYTDGAARGNPGPSASGYIITNEKNSILFKENNYNGKKTNNAAEYIAIINALKGAGSKLGYDNEIKLYSDSRVVINQLNNTYKIKSESLRKFYIEATIESKKFKKCTFINVPRENKNVSIVDKGLNILLDKIEMEKKMIKSEKGVQEKLL